MKLPKYNIKYKTNAFVHISPNFINMNSHMALYGNKKSHIISKE